MIGNRNAELAHLSCQLNFEQDLRPDAGTYFTLPAERAALVERSSRLRRPPRGGRSRQDLTAVQAEVKSPKLCSRGQRRTPPKCIFNSLGC